VREPTGGRQESISLKGERGSRKTARVSLEGEGILYKE